MFWYVVRPPLLLNTASSLRVCDWNSAPSS
jgi:hypothetical protein